MHDTLPYPLKRPSRSQMVGHARTHANISWAHNRNMKFFSTSRIVLNIGCSSHLLTTPLDNFFVLDLAKFKDTIYIYISQHQSVARDFFHKSIRAISNFVKAQDRCVGFLVIVSLVMQMLLTLRQSYLDRFFLWKAIIFLTSSLNLIFLLTEQNIATFIKTTFCGAKIVRTHLTLKPQICVYYMHMLYGFVTHV